MSVFQPPPTWASPIIMDEKLDAPDFSTGQDSEGNKREDDVPPVWVFSPIWLKWFLDITKNVPAGGAGGGGGGGDVVGPASATDTDIALYDGVTGKIIKDSGVTIASLVTSVTNIIQVQVFGG